MKHFGMNIRYMVKMNGYENDKDGLTFTYVVCKEYVILNTYEFI